MSDNRVELRITSRTLMLGPIVYQLANLTAVYVSVFSRTQVQSTRLPQVRWYLVLLLVIFGLCVGLNSGSIEAAVVGVGMVIVAGLTLWFGLRFLYNFVVGQLTKRYALVLDTVGSREIVLASREPTDVREIAELISAALTQPPETHVVRVIDAGLFSGADRLRDDIERLELGARAQRI